MRYEKLLVAEKYECLDGAKIATEAPAVQLFSQRLVVSIAASLEDMTRHTRHIPKSYERCTTSLERKVFNRPPIEMVSQQVMYSK